MAVVGGSAAGLFTASLLARAGRNVHVFERERQFAAANRTLIVTSHMRQLLGPLAERCIVNEINRFELFTDGRSATVPLKTPDLVIERSRLISELTNQAQNSGVQLEPGVRFAGLAGDQHGIQLHLARESQTGAQNDSFACDAVVGADGAQSTVARAAGWPRLSTAPLVQAIVKLPSGMPPDSVRVWFLPDDTPYFYWLIPESAERGALGLIGTDGRQTRRCLERFLESRHFVPLSFQGARIPVYDRWIRVERKVGGGSVYLVGDAAAQVKVSTVGGIVTGFRGALGVSEAILNNGPSAELRALRRELDLHLMIRRSIHRFRQKDYSRLVDMIGGSVLQSLGSISRDDAGRVLWEICRKRPRLLLIGLRGLLTRTPLTSGKGAAGDRPHPSHNAPSIRR